MPDRIIALTTPTGHVGSRVVRLLLQAGVRPRVLVRDPGRLEPDVRERVDTQVGDLRDEEFVGRATAGVDALFCVIPEDFRHPDPLQDVITIADRLAAAVRTSAIPRVVLQSSVGAEVRHGLGLTDGLAHAETRLDLVVEATEASVLHLRCGYFFTNLLNGVEELHSGVLSTTADPFVAIPWVDPRDVGDVATVRLLSDGWSGRQVQAVHGPADLSFADVAAILSKVLGRPIDLRVLSDDERRRQLVAAGLSERAADGVVGMAAGLRGGFEPEQQRSMVTTTPTTLASWAASVLQSAMASASCPRHSL